MHWEVRQVINFLSIRLSTYNQAFAELLFGAGAHISICAMYSLLSTDHSVFDSIRNNKHFVFSFYYFQGPS